MPMKMGLHWTVILDPLFHGAPRIRKRHCWTVPEIWGPWRVWFNDPPHIKGPENPWNLCVGIPTMGAGIVICRAWFRWNNGTERFDTAISIRPWPAHCWGDGEEFMSVEGDDSPFEDIDDGVARRNERTPNLWLRSGFLGKHCFFCATAFFFNFFIVYKNHSLRAQADQEI